MLGADGSKTNLLNKVSGVWEVAEAVWLGIVFRQLL